MLPPAVIIGRHVRCVEEAGGPLAQLRRREADHPLRTGEPRHDRRLQQTLQVERNVVALLPERPDDAWDAPPGPPTTIT